MINYKISNWRQRWHDLGGTALFYQLEGSFVVHLLEDSSVVLVGCRAYDDMLIVVVVRLLLVLVVRMSPAARPEPFVGG